ncbi:MAG: hypothetical protein WAM14_19855 [Candidatus Nitrosopolaris sp.]
MKVYKISAITLSIKNMEKSCKFYSRIPGFKIVYGGSNDDTFATFKIGEDTTMYLNLELRTNNNNITITHVDNMRNFGIIIFHTDVRCNANKWKKYLMSYGVKTMLR